MTRAGARFTILIPAAGASARMQGRDKLLEPVRGRPLLADRVMAAASSAPPGGSRGAVDVVVTLPPRTVAPERWDALADTPARPIEVPNHTAGMSASLAAGVAALRPSASGVMVLPADMPDVTADDIRALIAAFDGSMILRGASADGQPGHPVLFPARDFSALATLTGDRGGRALLAAAHARVRLVRLPADHATTDLDTPQDWAAWRARDR